MRSPLAHGAREALRIVAVYALFGALWIYLSDSVLGWLIGDPVLITRLSIYKGWVFIALTALLLHVMIMRYIAGRERVEAALRRNEEELRSLLELLPAGVGLARDDGAIEYVNRYFSELFGYTPDDIPTVAQWSEAAYPDAAYRDQVMVEWRRRIGEARAAGRMEVAPIEVRVACKDGTERQVIIGTQLASGRTIVIFTDITAREQAQKELVKMQKLESLGVLAGGIAHDFNNILTAILGNITFAQRLVAAGEKLDKAGTALEAAEGASRRAAELAHQLLTFARGGEPVKRVVQPRNLLEESLGLVLSGSNVRAELELPPDLWAINADGGQISQALNNLLINAVQAMPDGGTVRVTGGNLVAGTAPAATLPAGRYVQLHIADAGCGIAPDDLKRIFDPYFTTKPQGNGLGLASVYSIVTRHGGQVSVQSEPGEGTVFTLLLPAASAGEVRAERPSGGNTGRAQLGDRLLVLDDEAIIRELLTAVLEDLGYRVSVCGDGEEVLRLYRESLASGDRFGAVIMDLTIPGGRGGKELAPLLLEMDPGAVLVVASGYSNDPVIARHREYGFHAALPKPFRADEVAMVLDRLLHGA